MGQVISGVLVQGKVISGVLALGQVISAVLVLGLPAMCWPVPDVYVQEAGPPLCVAAKWFQYQLINCKSAARPMA